VDFTEEERDAMRAVEDRRIVAKGTVILHAGQRSGDSYAVVKGCLRCLQITEDGDERTTAFGVEGDYLVPPCTLTGYPSDITIIAMEDTEISVSNVKTEAEIYRRFPRIESYSPIHVGETIGRTTSRIRPLPAFHTRRTISACGEYPSEFGATCAIASFGELLGDASRIVEPDSEPGEKTEPHFLTNVKES
jgi:hypothetical protein